MATIKPFRGLRFNVESVDLARVVSQPYDRIGCGLQEQYYDQSPFHIVRIIKGEELPADVPDRPAGPNVYTRARAYAELWRAKGVLTREDRPAIYVYYQTFTAGGQAWSPPAPGGSPEMTRKGFVAALELSAFDEGVVLPHERTHAGPKVDRLRLLRATEVHWGQILMLYPDPAHEASALLEAAIAGRTPDIDVVETFEKGVRQRMWVVTDEVTIRAVQERMAPKRNLIIADGHHRYETALAYRDEMRQEHPTAPAEAAFNYVMVTLVSMDDPGLVILPTHREILDYPQVRAADVLERARPYFEVLPAADLEACLAHMRENEARHAFGLYAPAGGRQAYSGGYHVLVLKSPALIDPLMAGEGCPRGRGPGAGEGVEHSLAWRSLDVSILHQILLEQVVGLPAEAVNRQTNVRYHRDPRLPVENVDQGRGNLVFFLNPTRIAQVRECAAAGERMPQKSTDFYPKVITGLAMMPVHAGERI